MVLSLCRPLIRPIDGASATIRLPGSVSNGLLTALIAYWPGNEASGNLLDLHSNALTLTDTNTVTNNTGKVYATARQYTAANSECHWRADHAALSTGDVDFTLSAWCYFDGVAGVQMVAGKDNETVREYRLDFAAVLGKFRFRAFDGTNAIGTVTSDTFGGPSIGTWYLVSGWHDSAANKVYIQVNNGTADSANTTGAPADTAAPYSIGGAYTVGGILSPFNGRIAPTMFWKSAAGAGGVLTAAQRTALYNSGAGLPYASFTV
ncbi:MAG: hypothetical protein BWY10_02528 [Chloroflexi bacterium ADurb.Bin180]|nr:MAG: hypothetical protein BWY10_02528 [Chloroflexi bacterium ADurb.Bin180]